MMRGVTHIFFILCVIRLYEERIHILKYALRSHHPSIHNIHVFFMHNHIVKELCFFQFFLELFLKSDKSSFLVFFSVCTVENANRQETSSKVA